MSFRIPLSAPDITEAEIAAVTTVLRSPQLSLGPELHAFESAFAAFHGMPHAVAVSSGTAGLHISLLTLGIGPEDEVILPSFAFIAVANAVAQVGATPVFVDIDAVTLNLDPELVEKAITARTRAILVVHTFGVPAEMDQLGAIARRHGLAILEDACEAVGARFQGCLAGTFGRLSVFGFYPNKQITTGEGGAILALSEADAARLRRLRNQGRSGPEWLDHEEPAFNYRLSDLACALGRVQLSRLDEILSLRAAAAERYLLLLQDVRGLELPPFKLPDRTISWFVFVIRVPNAEVRERVRLGLAAAGIASGRYFPPIHLQKAWFGRTNRPLALPVTEEVARRTLALPLFNRITKKHQTEVRDRLAKLLIPC